MSETLLHKVCINSVFVHGYFSIKTPVRLGKQPESTDYISGNKLDIFFNVRSYTLKLRKNIIYYLQHGNLHEIIRDKIEKVTPWKIRNISAKITNFQGTITISNCTTCVFNNFILDFLIQQLSVQTIGLAIESDVSTTGHYTPEEFYKLRKRRGYSYLTLDFGSEQKLKVQPSRKKSHIQMSFVFTRYSTKLQKVLETLQNLAVFFDSQPSDSDIEQFLNTQKQDGEKTGDETRHCSV